MNIVYQVPERVGRKKLIIQPTADSYSFSRTDLTLKVDQESKKSLFACSLAESLVVATKNITHLGNPML